MPNTFILALLAAHAVHAAILPRHEGHAEPSPPPSAASALSNKPSPRVEFVTVTDYVTVYPSAPAISTTLGSNATSSVQVSTTKKGCKDKTSVGGIVSHSPTSQVAFSTASLQYGNGMPGSPTPSPSSVKLVSSSAGTVVKPVQPTPEVKSSTAVVIQPITPTPKAASSTAVVIVPVTPMAKELKSSFPRASCAPKASRTPTVKMWVPDLQLRANEDSVFDIDIAHHDTLTLLTTIKTSSLPTRTSTRKPTSSSLSLSSRHSFSSPSSSSSSSSSSKAAESTTIVISPHPNCPYPYPGIHCAPLRTTLVAKPSEISTSTTTRTTTMKIPASSSPSPTSARCPYPGQKC